MLTRGWSEPPAPPVILVPEERQGPTLPENRWEEWSPIEGWSLVLRETAEERARMSTIPQSIPLMGLRSPATVRQANRYQRDQAGQTKAEGDPTRVSRSDPSPEMRAILGRYAEPPFNLDRLADMLYHSDTYSTIVRQFGIDSCSGWALVDASTGATETGEISPETGFDDEEALRQQVVGEKLLDRMTLGFDDQHITAAQFGQRILNDWDSIGQGHAEIVRDRQGLPISLIHVPAKLIRRGFDGRTFVQVDDQGRPVAFFRRFGAEIKPRDPVTGQSETPWAYISKDEAGYVTSWLDRDEVPQEGQREGDLKRELADFKQYHPAELIYGIPPIIAAFNSLVGNILASNRNVRFFINRGLPDYCVMVKATTAASKGSDGKDKVPKLVETIRDHMKNMLEGEDHRTMILRFPKDEVEVTFEEIGGKPSDQEWGEYLKDNRDNIIHVYGMQPSKIGIIETASLGTGSGETQDETYKRSQIEPRQEMLEGFFNIILDQRGLTAVRFEFNEFDVLDRQREVTILSSVAVTGALSINEIRAWASKIVKDQDFDPEDAEWANIPQKGLEYMLAGLFTAAEAGGGIPVSAAGIAPRGRFLTVLQRLQELTGARLPGQESGGVPDTAGQLRQGMAQIPPRAPAQTVPPPANGNGGRRVPAPARA